jgi:hypothetical protein
MSVNETDGFLPKVAGYVKPPSRTATDAISPRSYMAQYVYWMAYLGIVGLLMAFYILMDNFASIKVYLLVDMDMPSMPFMMAICVARIFLHGYYHQKSNKRPDERYFYHEDNQIWDKQKYWAYAIVFPIEVMIILGIVDNSPALTTSWLVFAFTLKMVLCMAVADYLSYKDVMKKTPRDTKLVTLMTCVALGLHFAIWTILFITNDNNNSYFDGREGRANDALVAVPFILATINGVGTFLLPIMARYAYINDIRLPILKNWFGLKATESTAKSELLGKLKTFHIWWQNMEAIVSLMIFSIIVFLVVGFRNNDDIFPKQY